MLRWLQARFLAQIDALIGLGLTLLAVQSLGAAAGLFSFLVVSAALISTGIKKNDLKISLPYSLFRLSEGRRHGCFQGTF